MVFLPIWQLNYIGYNAIKKWLSSKNCRYLKCEIQSIVAELNNRLIDWIFNDTLCKNAMSSGKVRFASCNFYICKKKHLPMTMLLQGTNYFKTFPNILLILTFHKKILLHYTFSPNWWNIRLIAFKKLLEFWRQNYGL